MVRVKTGPSSAVGTHKAREVAREHGDYGYDDEAQAAVTESGMPDISDTAARRSKVPAYGQLSCQRYVRS